MKRFSSAVAAVTTILSAGVLSAGALAATVRVEAPAPLASSGLYRLQYVSVAVDERDLASEQATAALYQRIEAASHVTCGERLAQRMTADLQKKYAACRSQAVTGAVAAVTRLKEQAAAR